MTFSFLSPTFFISPTIVTLALTLTSMTTALAPMLPANAADYGGMAPPLTFREEVLKLVNLERKRIGVPALVLNRPLNNAAQNHSDEMALRGRLEQILPGGGPLERRVKLVGYPEYSAIKQNIDVGSSSAVATVDGWMGNRRDRANILNPAFKELGVGMRQSDDVMRKCDSGKSKLSCVFMSGYTSNETSPYYWTQIFAAPK